MKESKFQVKHSASIVESEIDIDVENPQNNFEKLLSLQEETPAKEYRNLIQSMCENFQFEKSMIKKTSNIEIPPEIRSEMKKKQTFSNYNIVKQYAKFNQNREHFRNRKFASSVKTEPDELTTHANVKKNSGRYSAKGKIIPTPQSKSSLKNKSFSTKIGTPVRLGNLLENKKNKMLMDQSLLTFSENKVYGIMNDPLLKEKIFQEALLMDRLYDIELQKKLQNGINQSKNGVPKKFKGINPKHMRMSKNSYKTENDFHRQKHVFQQRQLQLYNYANKIDQKSMRSKKKENGLVLNTLLKFNDQFCRMKTSKQEYEESYNKKHTRELIQDGQDELLRVSFNKKNDNIYAQDLKIKKLFLKYSYGESANPSQIYQYIRKKGIYQFFNDFNLQQYLQNSEQLKSYIEKKDYKITIDPQEQDANQHLQTQPKYTMFDFLQIIYILAGLHQANSSIHVDINIFLNDKIWCHHDKVIPQHWTKLQKMKKSTKYQKILKISKLEERSKLIFEDMVKKRVNEVSSQNKLLLSFEDILEISYDVKLFPLIISKKNLRFIFLYCRSQEQGVNQRQFMDIWIVCALMESPFKQIQKKIKWVAEHLRKYIFSQ